MFKKKKDEEISENAEKKNSNKENEPSEKKKGSFISSLKDNSDPKEKDKEKEKEEAEKPADDIGFFSFFAKNYNKKKEENTKSGFFNRVISVYSDYSRKKEQSEENQNTYSAIAKSARLNKEFLALLFGSCLIATFGLLAGSTAVIIGAMIIAPLMMPILGFALGTVWGDRSLLWVSLRTLFLGSVMVFAVSGLISLILPGIEFNAELLGRVNPTLFDILIAIASGLVGAYAYANTSISNSISGVAIAVALMPPLCTIGIAMGQGELRYALGAALLYSINLIGISLAASLVFWKKGVHPVSEDEEKVKDRALQNVILSSVLLILIAIPVSFFTYQTYEINKQRAAVRSILEGISPEAEVLQLKVLRLGKGPLVKAVFVVPTTIKKAKLENVRMDIMKIFSHPDIELQLVPIKTITFDEPQKYNATEQEASENSLNKTPDIESKESRSKGL